MNWLMAALIAATVVSVYWVWVRPALRDKPSLKEFYEREESLWAAVRLKLAGLKQKLTAAVVFVAGVVVAAYDQIAPMMLEAGVDVQSLSDKIPSKAWPFILMGLVGLLQYFRSLSDKRVEVEIDVAETKVAVAEIKADVAEAKVETAEAKVETAEAKVETAQAEVKAAEAKTGTQ